jgi:hypothetical protein
MSTTTESQAWLQELKAKGNLDDEAFKSLSAIFEKPEVSEYVKGSILRQQDYSRSMNKLQADYSKKLSEIEAYEKDLGNWRSQTETQVQQTQAQLAEAQRQRDELVKLAKSYGLEDELQPFSTPPTQVQPPQPAQDLSKDYLPRKEFMEVAQSYPLIVGEVNDIIAEHVELFGKQPKGMREVVEQAMREGRTIREVYEDHFSVADRRQELEKQAREAEITRRVEEEVQKYRTENSLPQPRPQREHGAVFSHPLDMPQDAVSEAQSRADSVRAAVNSWNTRDLT